MSATMAKKQIKVLIKSIVQRENYIYGLYVSPNCAENILLSVSFGSLCKRFNLYGWNGYGPSLPEIELTVAFCILANRDIADFSFVPGCSEECKISMNDLKRLISSELLEGTDCKHLYIDNAESIHPKTKEHSLLLEFINAESYDRERKRQTLNFYRYSLAIHKIIEANNLHANQLVPILEYGMFVSNCTYTKKELFWESPSDFFEKDMYPLNLAYLARNAEMIFMLLKKNGYKFSLEPNPYSNELISLLCFCFDNASDIEELNDVTGLIERHYSDVISKEMKILTIPGDYGYSSRQMLSSDGQKLLISWYKCILRLQSIQELNSLLNQYGKQLLGLLNIIDPYTGNYPDSGNNQDSVDTELEINKYILEHIAPQIKRNNFSCRTLHDCGIWGFDARTGHPIKEIK